MSMQIDARVEIDLKGIRKKAGNGHKAAQYAVDNQALKDSNEYIPADQWILRNSSLSNSKIGDGELIWKTPYARKLYYNPQYDFSTDKNPKAQGLWFEAAKAQNKQDWVEIAQRAFAEGFK